MRNYGQYSPTATPTVPRHGIVWISILIAVVIPSKIAAMQKSIPKQFEHQIPYVTTRIVTPDGGMGTGFFYQANLPSEVFGEGKAIKLLISAKHVFYDNNDKDESGRPNPSARPTKLIHLNLNRRNVDGSPIYGGGLNKTFVIRDHPGYWEHPDASVDLACRNVSILDQSDPGPYIKHVTSEFLDPIDYYTIGVGAEVTFIGYPSDTYDVVNNLPLIRKGVLASLAYLNFGGRPELVIDAETFPGSSGSPVFFVVDRKHRLLGVLARAFKERQGILPSFIGLGVVLKRELVKELVEYAIRQFSTLYSNQNKK